VNSEEDDLPQRPSSVQEGHAADSKGKYDHFAHGKGGVGLRAAEGFRVVPWVFD